MIDNPRPDRHRANKQRHTSALANNRKINETTKLNRHTESSEPRKALTSAALAIRSHSWPCLSVVVHDRSFIQPSFSFPPHPPPPPLWKSGFDKLTNDED